jgi:hypothetical protein
MWAADVFVDEAKGASVVGPKGGVTEFEIEVDGS